MKIHHTQTQEETISIGTATARTLYGGDIVFLEGELGAGKTTFMQGLAAGLQISDPITSPTFSILNVYPVPSSLQNISILVHIDTYRLKSSLELTEIGFEEYLNNPQALLCIEWPERITDLIPSSKQVVHIRFEHTADNHRMIRISSANAKTDTVHLPPSPSIGV